MARGSADVGVRVGRRPRAGPPTTTAPIRTASSARPRMPDAREDAAATTPWASRVLRASSRGAALLQVHQRRSRRRPGRAAGRPRSRATPPPTRPCAGCRAVLTSRPGSLATASPPSPRNSDAAVARPAARAEALAASAPTATTRTAASATGDARRPARGRSEPGRPARPRGRGAARPPAARPDGEAPAQAARRRPRAAPVGTWSVDQQRVGEARTRPAGSGAERRGDDAA